MARRWSHVHVAASLPLSGSVVQGGITSLSRQRETFPPEMVV